MVYEEKEKVLKNEKKAIFRSPVAEDAKDMLEYLKTCAGETEFLLRYPEECDATVEGEENFLKSINDSEHSIMIVCFVDGEMAGNCHLSFYAGIKTKHRANVAIALKKKFWGMGIGTALFQEMIQIAKEKDIAQLELTVIEGNERAKALYEKMGFSVVAEHPNAIRLKDGTMLKEFLMIKTL